MMMSLAGVMVWWGMRAGAPSPEEVAEALQLHASTADMTDLASTVTATQMLLADLAAHFSHIRILGAKAVDDHWQVDTMVRIQTRRTAPTDLKIQFQLRQLDADWTISAAKLLQA